ncbi:MAG: PAS domain S-box protein [Flavobacteriales bacterium]|nr:PAS domain S-box protein [Flavobacteriales bacterium]
MCSALATSYLRLTQLVFFLLLGFFQTGFAQEDEPMNQKKIDSLIMVLSYSEENADKVDVLNSISTEFLNVDYKKSLEYSELALNLAEKLNYQEGVVQASIGIGNIYINYSLNYYKGLPHLTKALEVAESIDDQQKVMQVYRQFAYLNSLLGQYDKAIEFNFRALDIAEDRGKYEELSEIYAYIGDLYIEMGDIKKGMDYYQMVFDIETQNDFEKSTPYALVTMGKFHRLQDDYPKSLYFFRRALKNFNAEGNVRWSSYVHSQLGGVYLGMKEYEQAILQGQMGLNLASSHNLKKEKLDNFMILAVVHDSLGDFETSLIYYKKYSVLKDSILTSRMTEQTEMFQSNFENVIEQNELKMMKAEKARTDLENQNSALMMDLAIGATVAALFIAFLLFLRIRHKSKINAQLETQKVELTELSLVASNTTNSIIIFDPDVRVLWVNNGFEQLSGLKFEDVKGRSMFDFPNVSEMGEEELRQLKVLFDSKVPFTRDAAAYHKDGSKYWVSMSITPVLDEQGELAKFISVGTNITELVNLEEQYESLVEGSSDAIYELNLNGNFSFVNDKMAAVTQYSKEELKEMHYTELIHEDHVEKVRKFYSEQFFSKEPSSYIEYPLIAKSGKEYWIGQNAQLQIQSDNGRVCGYQMIARNITEKKLAEDKLNKTHDNTRLLSEIGKQITSSLSVNDIIDKVYENINKLMDANVFGIAIHYPDSNELRFPAIVENNEKLGDVAFDLDDETRLGVLCFKERKEIVIGDYVKEVSKFLPTNEVATPVAGGLPDSTIYLPLILKDHIIGVITVQSFERNAYDEYQVDMVRSIASFASIAIDNAGLYQTMEERVERRTIEVRRQKEELEINYANTKILSNIGLLVSTTLDFGDIFDEVHESIVKMMDAEIFGVRLYEEENNSVLYKYEIESGVRDPELRISMDEKDNYTVWCVKNQKKIIINDNAVDYKKYVDEIKVPSGKQPESLLFYPMIVDNKVIGVITVQSFKKNAYQNYHLDILKTLSSYIGTAIDNAVLYETLEQKVRERTLEVRQKNKDITASINYAKRIQTGMLPSQSFMEQLLQDTFVLFKPRDIVSGDFYWMDRYRAKILMAVVDCTGHGVPGAMMSIIGRNLLDQAVNEKGLTMPSQILNFLQVGLMVAFGQTENEKSDVFDGMDISLCCIDLANHKLEFAGANNPLYIIRDEELEIVKGDKVGISAQYQAFGGYNNVEMDIEEGDMIYLFSDGYPDQFGGDRNKKFTYKRFGDLLIDIHLKPVQEQLEVLEETIEEWKGDRDQTDDVCIMGTKITFPK